MLLTNRKSSKFIIAVVNTNLAMFLLIFLCVKLCVENRNFDNIIGVIIGGILVVFFDLLFFAIRKFVFLQVYLENEEIIVTYFKKQVKCLKIKDIKLVVFNRDTVFLLDTLPMNIDKKNIQKSINHNTISFRISIDKMGYLFSGINVSDVYACTKLTDTYLDEIQKHAKLTYLWIWQIYII